PLRSPAGRSRARRPRSPSDGRGLHSRPRVRPAADRRRGRRDRSAGDDPDRQPVDPRRDSVPADETEGMTGLPFECQIALRYLCAKRKQALISLISFISILGVGVGVMAVIIALAIMTGLQQE